MALKGPWEATTRLAAAKAGTSADIQFAHSSSITNLPSTTSQTQQRLFFKIMASHAFQ
jgi:hypothetical protein